MYADILRLVFYFNKVLLFFKKKNCKAKSWRKNRKNWVLWIQRLREKRWEKCLLQQQPDFLSQSSVSFRSPRFTIAFTVFTKPLHNITITSPLLSSIQTCRWRWPVIMTICSMAALVVRKICSILHDFSMRTSVVKIDTRLFESSSSLIWECYYN